MMKIIVLRGVNNSGKTTTLNMVIDLLLQRELPESEIPVRDERVAIEYNGKLVLVTTYGDGVDKIERNLHFLNNYCKNVDVFVTATWSYGVTVEEMEKFAKVQGLKPIIIDKTYCPENSFIANKEDAKRIIELI